MLAADTRGSGAHGVVGYSMGAMGADAAVQCSILTVVP